MVMSGFDFENVGFMVTYSKLFLLIDALSKGIDDCIRESILSHV